ncbi:MAG: J domain-containing protein [Planctomycetes bacterium]|nr:J domain-containing protein [Planctomycetota bacterium]
MPFQREGIERDGTLMPRRVRDGGPFFLYRCTACRRPSHVERNRAGFLMAAPPPIVPFAEALWATFSSEQRLGLEAKRDYAKRRPGRKAWFHGPYADELVREGQAIPLSRAPTRRRRKSAPPPAPEPSQAPEEEPTEPGEGEPPLDAEPATDEVESHYEVLGVAITADRATVERAFRELAKQYHPDKFAGLDASFQALAHAKFKRITAARDALLADLE